MSHPKTDEEALGICGMNLNDYTEMMTKREDENKKFMDDYGHILESQGVLFYLSITNQALNVLEDCGQNCIPERFITKYNEAIRILRKLRTETIEYLRDENYHKDKVGS